MKIGGYDVVPTAKAVAKDFSSDDVTGLGAEAAFHIFFSIVPLLIFLTALMGFISDAIGITNVMDSVREWLFTQSGLPQEAAQVIRDPIENVLRSQSGGLLSIGALLALWSAKNAVSSLMKALNVAFDVEEGRNFLVKNLIAIGLTISLGLGIAIAAAILLAGGFVGNAISSWFGLGAAWQFVWGVIQIALVPLTLVVALAFLYWAGPNVDAPLKWLTPGAVVAVVLWVVATFALRYYFQYAAGYVTAYGLLGGILAFLFWIYVMAVILILGGSINSVVLRLSGEPAAPRQPKKDDDANEPIGIARARAKGATPTEIRREAGQSQITGTPVRSVGRLPGIAKAAVLAAELAAIRKVTGRDDRTR